MWYEILAFIHHVAWLIYSTLAMAYQSLLLIGAIGLAAQALFGFLHVGHHGHGHADADAAGHAHAGAGHLPSAAPAVHGHGAAAVGQAPGHHAGDPAAHAHDASSPSRVSGAIWTLVSPLTVFSFLLGVGATGLLLGSALKGPWQAFLAILGGVLFYRLIVRPLWAFAFRFASAPAESLAGSLAKEAVAMSRFDADGKGVVRVTVDGQLVRLLAYLDRQDREKGVTVAPGDRLTVTGVDGARNRCTVTRL